MVSKQRSIAGNIIPIAPCKIQSSRKRSPFRYEVVLRRHWTQTISKSCRYERSSQNYASLHHHAHSKPLKSLLAGRRKRRQSFDARSRRCTGAPPSADSCPSSKRGFLLAESGRASACFLNVQASDHRADAFPHKLWWRLRVHCLLVWDVLHWLVCSKFLSCCWRLTPTFAALNHILLPLKVKLCPCSLSLMQGTSRDTELSEAHWSKHELGPPKLLGPDSEPPVAGLGLTSSKLPSIDSIELLELKDPVSAWKYTHRRHSSRHCRQGCRWAQCSGAEGPFHPAGLPFATRHRRRGWRPLLVVPGSTRLRIFAGHLLNGFGSSPRRFCPLLSTWTLPISIPLRLPTLILSCRGMLKGKICYTATTSQDCHQSPQ